MKEEIEMTNHANTAPASKYARHTGILFLLSLLVPLLNWTFVVSKFIVSNNAIATINNIVANDVPFRIGILNQLLTSFIAIALSLALYTMVKHVNKNLALLALLLKLTEAILIAVIALGDFMALLVLNSHSSLTVFGPNQIPALIGLFVNIHISVTAIPMIFLGLNLMVFLYLLYRSHFVPKILAVFGIVSYALIFLYALITVLSPNYASILLIQTICWAPSCCFELMIGLWLLIRGIKVQQPVAL
jgi:hypothetical protein